MVLFLGICAGASQEHLNLKLIGFPLNLAVLLVGPSDEESPHPLRSLVRGNSLVVQGLGPLPSAAAVTGSMHGWGTRVLQLAVWDQKRKVHILPSHRMDTVSLCRLSHCALFTHAPSQSDTESCQLHPPHCSDLPFLLFSRSLASVWPFASRPVSQSLSVPQPSPAQNHSQSCVPRLQIRV